MGENPLARLAGGRAGEPKERWPLSARERIKDLEAKVFRARADVEGWKGNAGYWKGRVESLRDDNENLRAREQDQLDEVEKLREALTRLAEGDVPGVGDWGEQMQAFALASLEGEHSKYLVTVIRGGSDFEGWWFKAVCSCGWESTRYGSEERATVAAEEHNPNDAASLEGAPRSLHGFDKLVEDAEPDTEYYQTKLEQSKPETPDPGKYQ